jgi:hypothetical protein
VPTTRGLSGSDSLPFRCQGHVQQIHVRAWNTKPCHLSRQISDKHPQGCALSLYNFLILQRLQAASITFTSFSFSDSGASLPCPALTFDRLIRRVILYEAAMSLDLAKEVLKPGSIDGYWSTERLATVIGSGDGGVGSWSYVGATFSRSILRVRFVLQRSSGKVRPSKHHLPTQQKKL